VSKHLTISGRLFVQNIKFIKRHEIGQIYKNKNSDIDFGSFWARPFGQGPHLMNPFGRNRLLL